MDNNKRIIQVFSVFIGSIALVFCFYFKDCLLQFKENVGLVSQVRYLSQLGVIAIIIERFTDKVALRESYATYTNALNGIYLANQTLEETKTEFKNKFYSMSLALGLLVASVGFRYFDIIIEGYQIECFKGADHIFNYINVFLSGILLAGGAGLIQEIILWIKKNFLNT